MTLKLIKQDICQKAMPKDPLPADRLVEHFRRLRPKKVSPKETQRLARFKRRPKSPSMYMLRVAVMLRYGSMERTENFQQSLARISRVTQIPYCTLHKYLTWYHKHGYFKETQKSRVYKKKLPNEAIDQICSKVVLH